MKSPRQTSRRQFIRTAALSTAAAASFPSIVSASALGKGGTVAPSERISLGVIGVGPRCRYVLPGMLSHEDVECVAIADVQRQRREAAKGYLDEHHGADTATVYRDFREILDRSDVDAVLIATGDRWHAAASILAAEAGKDVYSEKPCGITIADCQRLADTMGRTGRVFQAGTQRRSVTNFQQAVALAHSGRLGKLHTLHASVYVPEINTTWLPGEPTPDPAEVDWNMWLGPAPWRLYNSTYVAGGWRGYYDFDSGARIHDWGAHTVDLCQWANQSDDTMPVRYEPFEDKIVATYEHGVQLVLHFLKTPFGERPGWVQSLGTCPVRFEGEEGWVETGDAGGIEVSSPTLKEYLPKEPAHASGLDVQAHSRNFLDCITSREPTAANPTVMRHSHITCHAAALAWMLKRTLNLDPATETFVNDAEANGLRARAQRDWAT